MGNTNHLNNYINAEINIKEEDLNKNIRIINSFENVKKEKNLPNEENDYIKVNEKEIQKCKIIINDKLIPFCYFYKFNQKGKYNIKYLFPKKLKNFNYIFYGCDSFTNIDLSNFNKQKVTNMSYMFHGCTSLVNIDLSNINSQNNTNLSHLFYECKSLTKVDCVKI